MSKQLVAYFSATGVTKRVATTLATKLGADLYEIKAKIPYTDADLNWRDDHSRSSVEMRDQTSRPEIVASPQSLSEYEVIYLGFPIWWGIAPTIVNTFLESLDFQGKKIITFATSGGSGMGRSTQVLQSSTPNAEFINGKVLNLNDIDSFIASTK